MHISDFDYDLPRDLIADAPVEPRDASRMMILDPDSHKILDSRFRNLTDFLRPSDVLVLNDTRVLKARTLVRLERQNGTSRTMEVFFVEPVGERAWQVLCRPGRRIRSGDRAIFGNGEFSGIFRESLGTDLHVLELDSAADVLSRYGQIPLPPYIDRQTTMADERNYQTVFAVHPGAIAAPTAGLHFAPRILEAIRSLGVEIIAITLHVGIGTFLPLRNDNPETHVLRPERYEISADAARSLQQAVQDKRRIIAVGTTTTRTLEFVMTRYGRIEPGSGLADLYILPGYRFRVINGLLTNFHLPRSTLLLLVSAFAGREEVLKAYRRAVDLRYRFYSYGDCMLILGGQKDCYENVSGP